VRLTFLAVAGLVLARVVGTAAGADALVGGTAAAGAVTLLGGVDPRTRLRRCLVRPQSRTAPDGAREAGGEPVPLPVVIDLIAAVVDAGMPPSGAVRMVGRCLVDGGDPAGAVLLRPDVPPDLSAGPSAGLADDAVTTGWRPLFVALDLAQRSGLGPVGLLRSAAAEQRRLRGQAQVVAARRLAVLAVMPTSLCLLPAFVLVTVVPLVLGLLRT
jgi:tight adherence protein B